jgi:hypothetical protein
VEILVLGLTLTITSDSSADVAQCSLGAIRNTLGQVRQLALGFLSLAIGILLDTGLAQVLVADKVADRLLGRADSLVPGTGAAVLVVHGGGAGVGVSTDGAQFGGGVRVLVFLLGLGFGVFGLFL